MNNIPGLWNKSLKSTTVRVNTAPGKRTLNHELLQLWGDPDEVGIIKTGPHECIPNRNTEVRRKQRRLRWWTYSTHTSTELSSYYNCAIIKTFLSEECADIESFTTVKTGTLSISLVYGGKPKYMVMSSPNRRAMMDWQKRREITNGLLKLSRFKILHKNLISTKSCRQYQSGRCSYMA